MVLRKGEPAAHWIGVLDGLLKLSNVSPEGKMVTIAGIPAGGWFGEGSLLKDEPRQYDVVALRDSLVALMPRATFSWLLDQSIPFNRFLLVQLNERLGQFIATVECDRMLDPDSARRPLHREPVQRAPLSGDRSASADLAGGDRLSVRHLAPSA